MRIMPMGDSITDQGTMPGYRGYLLQRLQQAGKHVDYVGSRRQAGYPLTDADHEGHPGLRNDELAALAGATVRTHQPDLVLLMAGANDLEQGHGPTVATDRMVGLLRTIYAARPAVRVVITTLIPDAAAPAEDVVAYNTALSQIVESERSRGRAISLIDVAGATGPDDYLADGVHPDDSGQRNLAAAVYPGVVGYVPR